MARKENDKLLSMQINNNQRDNNIRKMRLTLLQSLSKYRGNPQLEGTTRVNNTETTLIGASSHLNQRLHCTMKK